jgi:hypothetical protein
MSGGEEIGISFAKMTAEQNVHFGRMTRPTVVRVCQEGDCIGNAFNDVRHYSHSSFVVLQLQNE